jgi:hypothetical protein
MSSLFDRFIQRSNNVLFVKVEFTKFVNPTIQILSESFPSHGYVITIHQVVFHQEMQHLYQRAVIISLQHPGRVAGADVLGIPPIL